MATNPRPALLADACDAAIERLRQALRNADATFAPLGEAVMWLAALDEHLRKTVSTYKDDRNAPAAGQLMRPLRKVRDDVVHAVPVYRVGEARATGAYGSPAYGGGPYGGSVIIVWLNRSRYGPLAGSDVMVTLRQALGFARQYL